MASLRRTLTKCKVLGWMEQITGHGFTGTYQLSFPFYPRYDTAEELAEKSTQLIYCLYVLTQIFVFFYLVPPSCIQTSSKNFQRKTLRLQQSGGGRLSHLMRKKRRRRRKKKKKKKRKSLKMKLPPGRGGCKKRFACTWYF